MLSSKILCVQEGQLDKEFQSSSPCCTPMGFLRSLLTSFNAVAELQKEGAEVHGMATPSNLSSVATATHRSKFTRWLTRL